MARILHLDDDFTFLKILYGFLTKQGHEVTSCKSVSEALGIWETRESTAFDLLLLDYQLPDGNAMDFLVNAQSFQGPLVSRFPPAIIITSVQNTYDLVPGQKTGTVGYLQKPIRPDELISALTSALVAEKSLSR